MKYHRWVPNTDIMGESLNVGDRVSVFNEKFIPYENCKVTEKTYDKDSNEKRLAIQIDDEMWLFGLGNHEIIKEYQRARNKVTLINNGLGSLKQISDMLWDEMKKEIQRNGHSDLTLALEGAVHGIQEIVEINDIKEEQNGTW